MDRQVEAEQAARPGGRFFAVEHAVALILVEARTASEAYPRLLETIGGALDWQYGAVWEAAPGPDGFVRCVEAWCADESRHAEFARLSHGLAFPRGTGLPGRVWSNREAAWVGELATDANFPRATAALAAGFDVALCFPIRTASGVVGAVEFMGVGMRQLDEELLATAESLGSQIGQFVERTRAEQAVHESEAQHAAILDAALDCLVTIDDCGRILEFNAAAQRTFGYSSEEAVGREMAEVIVPPSLRDQHRQGFIRHLETGVARLLGRRVELTGMRSDGSEFPVELTITRIDVRGRTVFTAFIRDVTDRKLAEAELRASRVRLVEAQAAERRRLERNLHDGAQQRLVSLALALRLARERATGAPKAALDLLEQASAELTLALEELRELARGIHPAVLTERGLRPALEGLAERATFPVEVTAPDGRLSEQVEAAV